MRRKSFVSYADKLFIETTISNLISADQDNSLPVRIKSKGKSPKSIVKSKSKLLHIRKGGTLKCIHIRTPQRRTKLLQQTGTAQKLVLSGFR